MKLAFLQSVPYVCSRWAELAAQSPSSVFVTEEVSGNSYTRRQTDDLSARVYAWLTEKHIGREDFVLIRLPRDARPFIAMLGVTMVAAPGVPGGAIMAALGVLQSILGFTPEQQALMIALYIAMDSFGTAGNVTGDGALALIVDTVRRRPKG